jgi:hypothetical protein
MLGVAVVLPVLAFAGAAEARPGTRSYTVTHSRPGRAAVRGTQVITRRVVEPAATVGRQLSEQPVHPHLIEVRVVNATVWLDPDKDYIRQGHYKIDENHHIPAAQRLARSLMALPARTYWGSMDSQSALVNGVKPHMILMKPQFRHAPAPKPDRSEQERDGKKQPKMASAAG